MHNLIGKMRKVALSAKDRRGNILVLAAASLVMVVAFVAFTVDLGYIALTRTQMQNASDAAALAAAMELSGTLDPATVRANASNAAVAVAAANSAGNWSSMTLNPSTDIVFGKQTWNATTNAYTFQWGNSYTPYNVVQVFARRDQTQSTQGGSTTVSDQRLPLFFAPVLGSSKATVTTSSIATFQPRDIALVLDYSASMAYDSRFYNLSRLGRTAIENNLLTIYQDLGSPVYGKLTFTPQYASYSGVAASGSIPHITLTWKGTSLAVTSTSNITSVRIQYTNGNTATTNYSAKTATVTGNGNEIQYAWVKSNGNASLSSGNYGEKFDFTNTGVIAALGLTNVTYPYPAGSWSEFITTNTDSSDEIATAGGYLYKFGYMTWINYLQELHYMNADTPALAGVHEQPISVLKDGVDLFVNYINSVEADDQLALSVYSTPSGNSTGALLESGLTKNLTSIQAISRARQAGHYNPYTNIGAGMTIARQELVNHGRTRAFRLMVVMTDGVVNQPTSNAVGEALVLQEAQLAANAGIKIMTISMGALADTALMAQVASIGDGIAFVVPGGSDISSYTTQLQAAFAQIAASRPLKLTRDPAQSN